MYFLVCLSVLYLAIRFWNLQIAPNMKAHFSSIQTPIVKLEYPANKSQKRTQNAIRHRLSFASGFDQTRADRTVDGTAATAHFHKESYIEVTNAQHFDAFLAFPGYPERLLPLHRYFVQAMDMMYANLKSGAALPGSQVVRTVPRGLNGTVANPITVTNVPPIKVVADAADQITFANNVVTVAD